MKFSPFAVAWASAAAHRSIGKAMELMPAASSYKGTLIVSTVSHCNVMRLEDGVATEGSSGLAVPYSFRRYSGKPMLG